GDKGDRGPQGLRGPAGADASSDQWVLWTAKTGTTNGSWSTPAYTNMSEPAPNWIKNLTGSSVYPVRGVYEITAQAQNPDNGGAESKDGGGVRIYGRSGNNWVTSSGTGNNVPENNSATMIFDARD